MRRITLLLPSDSTGSSYGCPCRAHHNRAAILGVRNARLRAFEVLYCSWPHHTIAECITVQNTVPSARTGQCPSSMRTDVKLNHSDGALSMGGSTTGTVKFRGWHIIYSTAGAEVVRKHRPSDGSNKPAPISSQYASAPRPLYSTLQYKYAVLYRKRSTPRHCRLLQHVRTTPSRKPIGCT